MSILAYKAPKCQRSVSSVKLFWDAWEFKSGWLREKSMKCCLWPMNVVWDYRWKLSVAYRHVHTLHAVLFLNIVLIFWWSNFWLESKFYFVIITHFSDSYKQKRWCGQSGSFIYFQFFSLEIMESDWLLYMWHAGAPFKIRNNYQTVFEIQSILIVIMSNLDLNKTSMFFIKFTSEIIMIKKSIKIDISTISVSWYTLIHFDCEVFYLTFEIITKQ